MEQYSVSGQNSSHETRETYQSSVSSATTAIPMTAASSIRATSVERTSGNRLIGSGVNRATSESYIYDAYGNAGGRYSGTLGSGLLSGGVCTTVIRDTREREKREIGMLNDRLADYIEKVRFLEAQNRVLSHDIDILKTGFSGQGGQIGFLYDSEIKTAQTVIQDCVHAKERFSKDVASLTAEVEAMRARWLEALSAVKGHRADLDVDLDKLAKLEADIQLIKKKIRIVEEEAIRIKRENQRILGEIGHVRSLVHTEAAAKNEFSLRVSDLLQRVKHFAADHEGKIEQELIYIRRDTTPENRDYFRRELQAAIRDIRAEYERISTTTRTDIEGWYRRQVDVIYSDAGKSHSEHSLHREEILSIRSTLSTMRSRLAELESRNLLLEKQVQDLTFQSTEDNKLYEASLAEKEGAITRMREKCTELFVEMERLCEHQISLRVEIENYRKLLEGANLTAYTVNTTLPAAHYVDHSAVQRSGSVGHTRVYETTTTTSSHSNANYSGSSRHLSGLHLSGAIGGVAVGASVGYSGGAVSVGGNVGGHSSGKRPDRIHDEEGTDDLGRDFHRWYKGTIRITDVTPEFIELENICIIRRVDVGGFRIVHQSNGRIISELTIPHQLILQPKETLKIFSTNTAPTHAEFIMNVPSFDSSSASRTSLYISSEPHEERAWMIYTN